MRRDRKLLKGCFITHSVDEKIIDANPQQEGPTDILVSEMLFPSISVPWGSKSVKQVTTRSDITLHLRDSTLNIGGCNMS